ncbi:MAG: ABC transporter ATP-binding protein [Deltaproteobacteria bacterium]|nr:ABC transporter ATP-binding protein [Deltaproteobacteria bacterium]MBM4322175.1 ABC transporter ATP-binding protein [Deltaproteobacteria bacterium]MBM4347083.1 ABC transporter ATP-binding protein [Deltaproteobacteria bacterium]
MLLSVEEIVKNYDGVRALNRISLQVRKGTVKGLMGPNGAGKSTLFHLISGMEKPDSGRICFKEKEISGLPTHEISQRGVGRTFQTLQVFGNMTVVENVLTGMHMRIKGGLLSSGLWFPWIRTSEEVAMKEAKEILEQLGLFGRWKWFASQLSYGEQKQLEIARALAAKPDLLLLDEPVAGLTYPEAKQLAVNLSRLRETGLTLFLIEHHMGMVMEIADEVAVLNNGELLAEGPPDVVKKDPGVIEAYMLKK